MNKEFKARVHSYGTNLNEGDFKFKRASGAMVNVSDYGSEISRFDSWLARLDLKGPKICNGKFL